MTISSGFGSIGCDPNLSTKMKYLDWYPIMQKEFSSIHVLETTPYDDGCGVTGRGSRFTWHSRCSVSNFRWIVFLNQHVREHGSIALNYVFPDNFSESPINYHKKRTKTFVEADARCITQKSQNVGWGRRWLWDVGLQLNTNTTR